MRIGMLVTGHYTVPPPKGVIYAPMYIAETLGEGLTKKGHQVYFFAPEGSKLKVTKIISGGLKPLCGINETPNLKILNDPETNQTKMFQLWDQYIIALAYKEALKRKIDLLHIHPIDRALPFGFAFNNVPVVYTLHDPVSPWRRNVYRLFQSKNQHLISISDSQRKPAPDLNYAATIYNGLDLNLFPFSLQPKNQVLFLGRLLPTKGPHLAVTAAKKAKERIIIVGTPNKGDFWENKIKPRLGRDVRYLGNVPYEKTYKHYGQAKALLCPIQWEEPFGLTFIEAMACGTPVIAFDRGSVPEVIKDGRTGFIVKNAQEMARAIKKIGQIKREDCRKWVEENFTLQKMVADYEKVFREIIKKSSKISL